MSRQNKAKQKKIIAQQITALHKSGQRGPKATTAKHGKVLTMREIAKRKLALELAKEAAAAQQQAAKAKEPAKKAAPKAAIKGAKPAAKPAVKPAGKTYTKPAALAA